LTFNVLGAAVDAVVVVFVVLQADFVKELLGFILLVSLVEVSEVEVSELEVGFPGHH
jgi:hypothetical protein